jgi:hypothetical protein
MVIVEEYVSFANTGQEKCVGFNCNAQAHSQAFEKQVLKECYLVYQHLKRIIGEANMEQQSL